LAKAQGLRAMAAMFIVPQTASEKEIDMKRVLICLLTVALAMNSSTPASAQAPFSEIVVFGDSALDPGNVFLATGGMYAGPPYFEGHFSNGPVWVEVLAEQLGLPVPAPFLLGGTNVAVGGAETGPGLSAVGAPNVQLQIELFLDARGGLAGDELIVIPAGSNDVGEAPSSPRQIARNISDSIAFLAAAGGRTFMVQNLGPLGQSPLLRGTPEEVRFDTIAAQVNELLDRELDELEERLGIRILRLDVASLFGEMLQHPHDFGLTNVTDPACPGCGTGQPTQDAADTMVPNPDEYLWWDFSHFSRVTHATIGRLAAEVVMSEVQP
jgi:phospholipase/lecithinase/hemolysin